MVYPTGYNAKQKNYKMYEIIKCYCKTYLCALNAPVTKLMT